MAIPSLSRSAALAVVLGLFFTIWVNPSTTAGWLLLIVASSAVVFVAVSALRAAVALIRARGASARKTGKATSDDAARTDAPAFKSRRQPPPAP